MVISDIELGTQIANETVSDIGLYTAEGLRSGVAYRLELFVVLGAPGLYGQNSSVIGATTLGKLWT